MSRNHKIELDEFDKVDVGKIMKIICDEWLKLFSPRKRKYAQKLMIKLKIPSDKLTWESLNSMSSDQSIPLGTKDQCATCTVSIK